MKKKLLSGLLLATLAIGTFSPATVMAATTTTKEKAPTKVDGVKISDLLTGKYNNITVIHSEYKANSKTIINKKKNTGWEDNSKVEVNRYYETEEFWSEQYTWLERTKEGKTETKWDGSYNYVEPQKYDTIKYIDRGQYIQEWPLGSRKEELAKWKLDPSRFKTKSTKVTDKKITIKGTYTLTAPKVVDAKVAKKDGLKLADIKRDFANLKFDYDFWIGFTINEVAVKTYKDIKCSVTLVFDRETKQIISLKMTPKLPKDGYYTDHFQTHCLLKSNKLYTFEHSMTEEYIAKLTETEMISGKANMFDSIEVKYKTNYNQDFLSMGNYEFSTTFTKDEVETSGFDLSRFEITSSKTDKNTTTINGVYKLSTDSNTLYDVHARESIYWNGALGNYNDVTADVTIVFNAKTKSMKEITLQYNFDAGSFIIEESNEYDAPEHIICSHTYTFK